MPPWALVTPSSRGIGLSLVRRLLRTTKLPVVATARGDLGQTREAILKPAEDKDGEDNLVDEERLHILKLDFLDESSIASAAASCRSLFPSNPKDTFPSHLHLALILPGILYPERSPSQLDLAQITSTFHINTISHLLMLKHFSSFLPRKSISSLPDAFSSSDKGQSEWTHNLSPTHATWATMSARVGSVSDNTLGGWYSYRASKAALNQITKTFDNHLKTSAGEKAIAVSLHPGTVRTGLSKEFWGNVKEGKLFSPEFAAERLVDVVAGLDGKTGRGRCWDWEGKEITP